MTRSAVAKKILFAFSLLIVIVLITFIGIVSVEKEFFRGGMNFAEESTFAPITITKSSKGWTKETFRNASDFSEVVFCEEEAYYYELNCGAETQYSMDAMLNSDKLDIYDRQYTLGLKYYTKQRESTPNIITVYGSEDGENYVEYDSIKCFDNGVETPAWKKASLTIGKEGSVKYLRFVFTVYYSGEGTDFIENSGIYMSQNYTLTATPSGNPAADSFSVNVQETDFLYDKRERIPDFSVVSDTILPYYYTTTVTKEGLETSAESVGEYNLAISIFNDANGLIKTVNIPFTISPQSISLESYSVVGNGKYAVLLDAMFVDGEGRKVGMEEAQCKRVYDNTAEFIIEVINPNFMPYSARLGRLVPDASGAGYLYYLEKKDIVSVYNGSEQNISEYIKVFSDYNFSTGEFTELSASLVISFYQDGQIMQTQPKDVGNYTYKIEYGSNLFEGTFTIIPKTLSKIVYSGTANFDKFYDGNTDVAVDGAIVNTADIFTADGIVTGDEVSFECGHLSLAREIGATYLIAEDCEINGADSNNYQICDNLYSDIYAKVKPTTLYWSDLKDINGDEVAVTSREYDGTNNAVIANEKGTALVMKGLGKGQVTYEDLSIKLKGKDSGEQEVLFTLINASLFDKYSLEIIVGKTAKCLIEQKKLTATVTNATMTEKEYDGEKKANPSVNAIVINDVFDFEDGFNELIQTGEYLIQYEVAEYDSANCGLRTISIKNALIHGFSSQAEKIYSNYEIVDMNMDGEITPIVTEVITENLRIYKGQALPDIETTANNVEIIDSEVYATYLDAEAETNKLPSTTQITETGDYFVKAKCSSNNYQLTGNVIIPLAITEAMEKAQQNILIEDFNIYAEQPIIVPVGGVFVINAKSITTDGMSTGLEVNYTVSERAEQISKNEFTAVSEGLFTITANCKGNDYYEEATAVEIEFLGKKLNLDVEFEQEEVLYVGDGLPQGKFFESAIITNDDEIIDGGISCKEGELKNGINQYKYFFEANPKYREKAISFSIESTVYENNEGTFTPSADTQYVDGKAYYRVNATIIERERGTQITDTYYELLEGSYVPTEDTIIGEKQYYALVISEDTHRVVSGDGYYTYDGESFNPVPIGTVLTTVETYYTHGKEFYGKQSVFISLTAEKRAVEVILGGELEVPYGQEINLLKLVQSLEIDGLPIPINELESFKGGIILQQKNIAHGGEFEGINPSMLGIGEYCITGDGIEENSIKAVAQDEEFNYKLNLTGRAVLRVVKKRITIYANNLNKYYYTATITEDKLKNLIKIDNEISNDDMTDLLSNVIISTVATQHASIGDYLIEISGTEETDKYIVDYNNGYMTVIPTQLTVFAISSGHTYGRTPNEIYVSATVTTDSNQFSYDDITAIRYNILKNTEATANVTAYSDAGDYPIDITFFGDNKNYLITFNDSFYTVSPASFTGINFSDENVLYDGRRHFLRISYDKERWGDLTISYNNDYFVEKGVYEYTATISKKNYKDLTLKATLTIGTLTLSSSSTTHNNVSISVPQSECEKGLSPEMYVELRKTEVDNNEELNNKVALVMKDKKFNIDGAYNIGVFINGEEKRITYSVYELQFSPSDIKYNDKLILFGYDEDGNFGRLEYEYENGVFSVKTSSLKDLVFVTEVKENISPIFIWGMTIIFAIIIFVILGIVLDGGKRSKRERASSRRRHHRWV